MTSLELVEEEIQVWVASLQIDGNRQAELERTLAAEERERASALPPVVARRYVASRGILRSLLSGFTGTPAQKLRFEYGFSGKPSLAAHDINFNISHSADLGLFAFAPDRAVGVDVENVRPVRRLLDVAQRFMSDEELRELERTSPDKRDTVFLQTWVVREARLKAEGKGVWSPAQDSRNPGVTHKLFSPSPGYLAAVAAPDSNWRLFTCAMKQ